MREIVGIASLFLNVRTTKNHIYTCHRRLYGPKERFGKVKNVFPVQGTTTIQPLDQSLYQLCFSGSLNIRMEILNCIFLRYLRVLQRYVGGQAVAS